MEEKMNANAFYEHVLEKLENDKKVSYNAIRYLPMAMAVSRPSGFEEQTYIHWLEFVVDACYNCNYQFNRFGLKQDARGILSIANALERERENVLKNK